MEKELNDYFKGNMTLFEILQIGIKRKLSIFFITSFFGIFSVFYTLSIDNIYESKTVLEVKQNSKVQSNNNLSAISSLAGISLGGQNNDVSKIIQILESRDFAKHLIGFDGVLESILAVDFYDNASKKIVFDDKSFDVESSKWVRVPNKNQKQTPTFLEAHYELKKNIISYKKIDDLFIEISIEHQSPIFAKDFLDLIIRELNRITREKDIAVSNRSLDFLNKELQKTKQIEIRKSINELIKPNLEMLMLADIDEFYKLEPIDKPFYPEEKAYPNRTLLCIIITFFGFIFAYSYVLITHIFSNKEK